MRTLPKFTPRNCLTQELFFFFFNSVNLTLRSQRCLGPKMATRGDFFFIFSFSFPGAPKQDMRLDSVKRQLFFSCLLVHR